MLKKINRTNKEIERKLEVMEKGHNQKSHQWLECHSMLHRASITKEAISKQ